MNHSSHHYDARAQISAHLRRLLLSQPLPPTPSTSTPNRPLPRVRDAYQSVGIMVSLTLAR